MAIIDWACSAPTWATLMSGGECLGPSRTARERSKHITSNFRSKQVSFEPLASSLLLAVPG